MVAKVRPFECRVRLGRGSGSYEDDGVRGRIGKAGFRGGEDVWEAVETGNCWRSRQ